MSSFAIVNLSEVATLAGPARPRIGAEMSEIGVLTGTAVLVSDGKIALVADERTVIAAAAGGEIVDGERGVLLPGFVDAHAHPVFAGNRVEEFEQRAQSATYEQIAASGGGIRSTVRKTQAATENELCEESRRHVDWFVANGTTTIEAKSGYGLTLEDELKMLRIIRRLNKEGPIELVPTFLGAHSIPESFRCSPDSYVKLVCNEMLPQVAAQGLAEYCDVFCERGYFSTEAAGQILGIAKSHGLGLRMHADQLCNFGAAALAASLGAVTADHLEHTEEDGIEAMKGAGVQPVLLPGSVYALGSSRYPQARQMLEAGLAVVLATDFNPGSSPTPSIPMVMSIAATHMKMAPSECLTAASVNAAYSLGRGDRIGSIEAGKEANLALFSCSDYRELSYYFGVNFTRRVWSRGQEIYSSVFPGSSL